MKTAALKMTEGLGLIRVHPCPSVVGINFAVSNSVKSGNVCEKRGLSQTLSFIRETSSTVQDLSKIRQGAEESIQNKAKLKELLNLEIAQDEEMSILTRVCM